MKGIRDYVYEGQIVDRVTEDEYATQNLMDVRNIIETDIDILIVYSMIKSSVIE